MAPFSLSIWGTLTNSQLVPTVVGSALGFMVQAHDPFGSLVTFLDEKKIFLTLDNCEHVIDSASELAERVVNEAPQAHILATSREALRVEGEHVHLLYSLDCPPEHADTTAAEVMRYPAVQLFMDRAAAAGQRTALSDVDAPIVASICRRLDGIALAIELAASRAGSLGICGIAELLDNRFSLLWHGRRTGVPRHQTMNAMLDWSYNLLPEQERVVLSRLSVFVGDFTVEAACSVTPETEAEEASTIEALESLLTKSLISTTQESDRHTIGCPKRHAHMPEQNSLNGVKQIASPAAMRNIIQGFCNATRLPTRGSASTISRYTPHT